MKISRIAARILFLCSGLLSAAEIIDFVPRHSRQVMLINLTDIIGMEAVRNDISSALFRQIKLTENHNKSNDFSSLIDKILVVTPVLTDSETFIFFRTKVKESEFLRRWTEMTAIRHIAVKNGNRTEYRISLPETGMIPGITPGRRTFAFAFLTENIAVAAKDSLEGYLRYKPLGLPAPKRKYLTVANALAAGFLETDSVFLRKNPFLPPFLEAVYSLAAGPDGSLLIKVSAGCADETAADQTLMMLQQYIMIGGMLLNQNAPELLQEWMNSIKISRTGSRVFLDAVFSKNFLIRLTAASGKLAGGIPPTAAPPEQKR